MPVSGNTYAITVVFLWSKMPFCYSLGCLPLINLMPMSLNKGILGGWCFIVDLAQQLLKLLINIKKWGRLQFTVGY